MQKLMNPARMNDQSADLSHLMYFNIMTQVSPDNEGCKRVVYDQLESPRVCEGGQVWDVSRDQHWIGHGLGVDDLACIRTGRMLKLSEVDSESGQVSA